MPTPTPFSVGAVSWPTWTHTDPNASTLVYAVVLGDCDDDPYLFDSNAETMVLVNAHPEHRLQPVADSDTLQTWAHAVAAEVPVLTAVLLGATNRAFRSTTVPAAASVPWYCSAGALDHHGRTVLATLAALYQREPLLVTFIDAPVPAKAGGGEGDHG